MSSVSQMDMVTLADIIMLALALVHHDLGHTNYASIFDY